MTELELLVDLHKDQERQGPGSNAKTVKALKLIDIRKKENLKITDIGCGSGAQTLKLAKHINGQITGVDLFPQFLNRLEDDAELFGFKDKVSTLKCSMDNLPFEKEELDIIWSEGAIYNMGFEAGIKYWKEFLKPGGYLAVSEITWITNERPREIEEYWNEQYPAIDTAANKIKQLEDNGYSLVGYLVLSQKCWLDNYYKPIEDEFPFFLERHQHSEQAKAIVAMEKEEIRMYQKYKDYYSYGFYIARK